MAVVSLPLSFQSLLYRTVSCPVRAQELLGCLVDFLRKRSCAGGLRDAVREAWANLQPQLLFNSTTVPLPSGTETI